MKISKLHTRKHQHGLDRIGRQAQKFGTSSRLKRIKTLRQIRCTCGEKT